MFRQKDSMIPAQLEAAGSPYVIHRWTVHVCERKSEGDSFRVCPAHSLLASASPSIWSSRETATHESSSICRRSVASVITCCTCLLPPH